jgi:hypothetical protein
VFSGMGCKTFAHKALAQARVEEQRHACMRQLHYRSCYAALSIVGMLCVVSGWRVHKDVSLLLVMHAMCISYAACACTIYCAAVASGLHQAKLAVLSILQTIWQSLWMQPGEERKHSLRCSWRL